MNKIFKYELRRLILNKFFIGLMVINGAFAWYVLTTDTVSGTAYTAPFSSWSFAAYLSSSAPIAILTVLFLMTAYFSRNERKVEALASATPVNPVRYMLVRSAALALGYAILCAVSMGLSAYFYAAYFGISGFSFFAIPAIVTLLPCLMFTLGLGALAGTVHQSLLYLLMLLSVAMGVVKFPSAFDFFGGGYYASYPFGLPLAADGEPAFVLSAAFLAARAFYFIAGLALLAVSAYLSKKKRKS